ncbi:DUF4192 domain-containing protein [Nocardia arthritidis]|uniref:DUF4192 family protein n=1 Tax=Nocardia arthritidis TaxID=228602 RepID=A0A6G9YLH6_9NOCA|nr:DUF4192 domain-containing protein [Nocardia arthritidis]QIS13783.1 DUF4192 family protein [Nocardia arthritidis]
MTTHTNPMPAGDIPDTGPLPAHPVRCRGGSLGSPGGLSSGAHVSGPSRDQARAPVCAESAPDYRAENGARATDTEADLGNRTGTAPVEQSGASSVVRFPAASSAGAVECAQGASYFRTGRSAREWRGAECGERPPRSRPRADPNAVRIDEPGDLIAAVPALVGFPPERSLVVAVLCPTPVPGGPELIDAVARFDVDQRDGRLRAETVAPYVVRICAGMGAAKVIAVFVDDRARESSGRRGRRRNRCGGGYFAAMAAALRRELAADDIGLDAAWAVPECEPGRRWWSLLGPECGGPLPDPAASMVAMSHVLDGRPLRRSRAELTGLVAADPIRTAEVAAHLDDAVADAMDRYRRAVHRGDPNGYSRQALHHVLWQIANLESGAGLDAAELAELVAALRDHAVRDTMFALAIGDHADAAEQLWIALVQVTTGPDRAETAALLGYHAYTRGDGPLAGVALQAALEADPMHPMARLLETSLYMGLRPEHLRKLAHCGFETATDLGVDLGPEPR